MSKKGDNLKPILIQIENSLMKQNSLRNVFLQGIVRGLGTALGATVLVAIITSLTIKLSSTISISSIIEQFFNGAI
ncbi:hypothetical protein H6781_00740 [Candidatus Nomurabacteria bacterium]|nr:hypothetical protein [Candidatus Kaiserbacteria bacterium]MCB9810108.1 hypothetical protein [Candidatus Nomurabacteria bacterium]MCB9818505.1 hypothetical protein [Candidatus Nomurabacteria bacterium]